MDTLQNTDPNGQVPNGTVLQPQAGTSGGQAPNETPNIAEDLQRQIAELRKENASHRRKFQEQTQAAQVAEEARLKEQGQFKELAEQHAARVKELEPVQERYTQLSTLLADQIKAQTKDWPKEVKDLLPDSETPIEVRYSQVQKLQALASKVADQTQQQQRASLPGNTPGPRQANQEQSRDQQKEEFRLRRKSSGMYGL